jgi:hypothetical protein
MGMQYWLSALILALSYTAAAAQPANWRRYVVPETGASVDIPLKNPPSDIVYRKITDRFFVASSFRNNMIWYNRCNFAGSYANCVLINYPAAEKRQWDSIVTRISNTLASQ